MVPPGLYLLGNTSGDVDICTLACVSLVLRMEMTSCRMCGQEVFKLTS